MNPRKSRTKTPVAEAEIVKQDSQEVLELKARLDQFRQGKVGKRIEALELENACLKAALTSISIISRMSLTQP